ncbi:MAG: hypothetical protein ACWGQW_16580, partial [bacterium]
MKITSSIIVLLAMSAIAISLESGKYHLSVAAEKEGRDKPYTNSIECDLSISNNIVFLSGLDAGQPVHFKGKLINEEIEFETQFPSNSVMAGMKIQNRYTGKIISPQAASGVLTGTAGT